MKARQEALELALHYLECAAGNRRFATLALTADAVCEHLTLAAFFDRMATAAFRRSTPCAMTELPGPAAS